MPFDRPNSSRRWKKTRYDLKSIGSLKFADFMVAVSILFSRKGKFSKSFNSRFCLSIFHATAAVGVIAVGLVSFSKKQLVFSGALLLSFLRSEELLFLSGGQLSHTQNKTVSVTVMGKYDVVLKMNVKTGCKTHSN
eukprot:Gb_12762 [translate_table: standard]